MKTGIVLCYGLFEETNLSYKSYLDWILQDCGQEGLERLIICGGRTNNLKPNVSEAETVAEYFHLVKPELKNIELDDVSLTTNQNLEFISSKIKQDEQVIIYCDLARTAKVIWMAGAYLLHKDRQEIARVYFDVVKDKQIKPFLVWNVVVKGFDFPDRDKYQYLAQTFSSLIEVEAIYNDEIADKLIGQRKTDFKI